MGIPWFCNDRLGLPPDMFEKSRTIARHKPQHCLAKVRFIWVLCLGLDMRTRLP